MNADLVAVTVLVVTTVLTYVLLLHGLRRADGQATPPSEPAGPAPYLEVGAWSGLTHPRGAVVVGYDRSRHAGAALTWAAREAVRREAPLVVLHAAHYPGMVGEPGPGLHHRDPDALQAAEEVTARGVAEARAIEPGLAVVGATEVTPPDEALVHASADAALVVVGTRNRGTLTRMLLGSVSRRVVRRSRSPVVVVAGTRGAAGDGVRPPTLETWSTSC